MSDFSREKILVRGVNWLGDAIMSTPALQRLREARPKAHISLLSPEKLAGLWNQQPFIDELLTFGSQESVWQIGRRLREKKFDVGVLFPNSPRSALEMWLGRIPQRIGVARPWRTLFLNQAIPPRADSVPMHKRSAAEINRLIQPGHSSEKFAPPSTAHHVYDYLHIVAALGAKTKPLPPRLWVGNEELEKAKTKFGLISTGNRLLLGLNPGAEYGPAKRWPTERFVATAAELSRQLDCAWLIFGGPNDVPLAEKIAAEIEATTRTQLAKSVPIFNLAGKSNLRELCALLKLCRFVLTNDTGPAHLAAAVGAPVITIFGSTSPELTTPGFGETDSHRIIRSTVPCSPCFLRECPIDFRCMKEIESAHVVQSALDLLGKPAP